MQVKYKIMNTTFLINVLNMLNVRNMHLISIRLSIKAKSL